MACCEGAGATSRDGERPERLDLPAVEIVVDAPSVGDRRIGRDGVRVVPVGVLDDLGERRAVDLVAGGDVGAVGVGGPGCSDEADRRGFVEDDDGAVVLEFKREAVEGVVVAIGGVLVLEDRQEARGAVGERLYRERCVVVARVDERAVLGLAGVVVPARSGRVTLTSGRASLVLARVTGADGSAGTKVVVSLPRAAKTSLVDAGTSTSPASGATAAMASATSLAGASGP